VSTKVEKRATKDEQVEERTEEEEEEDMRPVSVQKSN
jgi:hypothetical protein